jgi:hypothetical protein
LSLYRWLSILNTMNTIAEHTSTKNGSMKYDWGISARSDICELFNMSRGASKHDVVRRCPIIWCYDMDLFVALMFYMRGIRKDPVEDITNRWKYSNYKPIPKGRGEKLISYWMALWLLETHEVAFARHFTRFVRDIGYYKDCLIMAKMALELKYSNHKIMLILMPMVRALVSDESMIINAHINNLPLGCLRLSMAAKWAPRQGKSFSILIPYMKHMCGITEPKSGAKWRKYIQSIAQATKQNTIETLLSTKKYDDINFKMIPSKAFNLYKNTFGSNPELSDRFNEFLHNIRDGCENIHDGVIHPHDILSTYLNNNLFKYRRTHQSEIPATESQWKCHIDATKLTSMSIDREDTTFIPMIDISGSMFNGNALPIKAALSLGITLSQINTGIFKNKAITFSSIPVMMDVVGDTVLAQINSIFNEFDKPENSSASRCSTNFVKAFECILDFCCKNNVPVDDVAKIKVIALSDMAFDQADGVMRSDTPPFQSIRKKFAVCGYQLPQIIYWNLDGYMTHKPCVFDDTGVATLGGFDPSIIDSFLETGVLDPSAILFKTLNVYKQLIRNL